MSARLKVVPLQAQQSTGGDIKPEKRTIDLGNGSEVTLIPRFLSHEKAWEYFNYLNSAIPWTRPTLRVFGRSCLQPRDVCYVATPGLPELAYSGYKPHAYSWDDFCPLKEILEEVHKAIPGSTFNSLLLNRYADGNDNVGLHADNETLYGPTPEIASLSLGCERDFLLKKQIKQPPQFQRCKDDPERKRMKHGESKEVHSFTLKHGSLLVMRGNTQRDYLHSVPKRAKASSTRINLTFRNVV